MYMNEQGQTRSNYTAYSLTANKQVHYQPNKICIYLLNVFIVITILHYKKCIFLKIVESIAKRGYNRDLFFKILNMVLPTQ